MSYATQTDIEQSAGGVDRFAQLADWDGDGSPDAAVIARALAAADAFIDLYLRLFTAQTDLEWLRANPTQSVKEIASDEAIYSIRKWRSGVSEIEEKQHEERAALLKQINVRSLRVADAPSPQRAIFVENCGAVSRKNMY